MKINRHKAVKWLGLAAIGGSVALALSDGIGILLHSGYNPITNSISDLALGPTGWVQGVGLYLGGAGVMAFALGLSLVLSEQWEIKLGEAFLFLVGIGLVLAATFRTDTPGHASTISGDIHGWVSFASAIFALPTFFLISPAIRNNRRLFIYTIIAGILAIVLEVGRGRLPSSWVFFGLHERLIGANGFCWIAVTSWALLVRHKENPPRPDPPVCQSTPLRTL